MVITEIGVGAHVDLIESHPFKNDSEFLTASPLGKVPCLIADDQAISDSEVICDYLDASYTGGTLFNTIYADWRLKTFYSICSGLMDVCVARRIEILRADDNTQSDFWLQRHTNAIVRTLRDIEARMNLMPEEFSILHINLLSCLAYLDFRHQDIDWRAGSATIMKFYDEFSSRACFTDNLLSD